MWGVGVVCRFYLSVLVVECRLSRLDCELSSVAVGGCRWILVVALWLSIVCAGCRSVFPLLVPTSVSISDAFGDAKSIHPSVGLNNEILLKISVY